MSSIRFRNLASRILIVPVLLALNLAHLYRPPDAAARRDWIPVCELQGTGFDSPYAGKTLRTRGVVFGDLDDTSRHGFYLQEENCDGNPFTSDGIFVYLPERGDLVSSGDRVEVSGTVQEYFGMTELNASPAGVALLSKGSPLPAPQELNPPFENATARRYSESLEAMRVLLSEAAVVGPTDSSDQTWLVSAGLGIGRVFPDDPAGTGEVLCVDDAGLFEIAPETRVGDRVLGLQGALDYQVGVYCLQLFDLPVVVPALPSPSGLSLEDFNDRVQGSTGPVPASFTFTVATFNLANLFDTYDDPETDDTALSSAEYQRRLQKRALAIHIGLMEPAILAVQEVENQAVLQGLVSRPEIEADYEIVWENGPDDRGLDVALLYRVDRAEMLDFQVRQACTRLVDGLGPDGNLDMANPQNALTCDLNGDGKADGNRLFSRPPLVVHLNVFQNGQLGGDIDLYVIANHFKSKIEDRPGVPYTLPRRLEQAGFVASLVQEIAISQPGTSVIVLGDLNDTLDSQPISSLTVQGLSDLWTRLDRSERYSYLYQGLSQVLDHILVHLSRPLAPLALTPVHINADYPSSFEEVANTAYRSSDHDPILVTIGILDRLTYFPLVSK